MISFLYIEQGPLYSTQDIWSQNSMSTEIHLVNHMLTNPTKLQWVSVPVGLDRITGEPGQSKTLIDSAGRHVKKLKNWYVDSIKSRRGNEKLDSNDKENKS